ncbi:MAG: hypothetical protein Pg6C_16580 [Treponemataceae bacterium]|nr:MAG: hypothetical protein Pg6C_16580 [Treponemataceae bacterium]
MNEKPIFSESVLKCDYCDWVNDIPTPENEMAQWIGKPCPQCGKNLLTETDFKKHKRFLNFIKFLEKTGLVKDPTDAAEGNGVYMNMHIEKINGKYEINIKLSEGGWTE